ncbi:MAG: glycosyltransferase 87 family protein [Solirubrobacteraceae bacterium]
MSTATASAVADRERRPLERLGSRRLTLSLATLLSLVLVAGAAEIVLDAAEGYSPMVPSQPAFDSWLAGLGVRLGYNQFLPTLLISCVAYGGLVAIAGFRRKQVPAGLAIALVAALQLILFAGPVLLATDLFTNVSYGREAVLGINPYVHGPAAISSFAGFPYVSPDWIRWAIPYGPVFTLLTMPAGLVSLDAGIWILKLEVLIASAVTLGLTWRCARQRGFDPVLALIVVGANPLYVLYALGGSHNDLIMTAFMMGGVTLLLAPPTARREVTGAAAIVGGALVKATLAVMLPFLIVSKRRVAPIAGALAALAVGLAIGGVLWGTRGIDLVAGLGRESHLVSSYSFASQLAHLLGKAGVYPIDHTLLTVALVVVLVYLLWRTWRGYDWITASGWGLLAIAVCTTWLMPWYTVWPLPLAAISRDRRLLFAILAVQALWVVHQTSPLYGPVP